ncbi:MAG TPA: hypothetical protein VD996_04585 [Chitinophagaceae bacterium]|nr:hypothetical protein [Chitinophagaceae bacterium]
MNIDQLKTQWQRFDQKLQITQQLNEQLITSMLKERSRSRIALINRSNMTYLVLMTITMAFLGGILAGNPFDFRYTWQYIPYGILLAGVILAIISLIKSLLHFNVDLNAVNLQSFLQKTIAECEKSKRMQRWFGIMIFSAGLLTAFSFLPKKLENKEPWQAFAETGLMLFITLTIYFAAFRLGAFKDRRQAAFRDDWQELQQLRSLSADLRNE